MEVAGPNSAPSIFFWNGAFCNLRQWDYLCEELNDDFRLIRFDIRGTGKSHAYVGEAFEPAYVICWVRTSVCHERR